MAHLQRAEPLRERALHANDSGLLNELTGVVLYLLAHVESGIERDRFAIRPE
ncbi:hypothetical protein P3T23_009588 [Paraburkholderia sp. GAS448]|uniref:hypothetical protein n=1 Tax=Paraburkholderia sp. GAS448 TaxID=3035136 RepID=UPI003D1D4205